ncbi:hypothetical protein B484DRAFT_410028 [Ochromonadaceae sp. CCMP2298]|nr:hypothetical protein B484DRAFT_410028 [Ochromonadaceae sp. CCMP2298]
MSSKVTEKERTSINIHCLNVVAGNMLLEVCIDAGADGVKVMRQLKSITSIAHEYKAA